MKKKITLIAIAIAMVALFSVGSLAFFNAKTKTINSISTGNVGIELINVDENDVPSKDVMNVMPGQTIVKKVSVKNPGNNPVWIRVKATPTITDANQTVLNGDIVTLGNTTAMTHWTRVDEGLSSWYYYTLPVPKDGVTTLLYDHVKFSGLQMGNDYMDSTLNIDITAQAVQSEFNGTTVHDAQGWPAE